MEIGKVTPRQEATFTALDRLWKDIMMADIKAHSKKLDKKMFEIKDKVRYYCNSCKTEPCQLKMPGANGNPISCPCGCPKFKWIKRD